MRNKLSTGLSMPFVAISRNPANGGGLQTQTPNSARPEYVTPYVEPANIQNARENCGGVAGIYRAIAISILRILLCGARRAAFGIGFTENDGRILPFRKRRDDRKSLIDRRSWCEMPI